jgi:hypothetical protein
VTQRERSLKARRRWRLAVALREVGLTWAQVGKYLGGCSGPRAFVLYVKGMRIEEAQRCASQERASVEAAREAAAAEAELDELMASNASPEAIREAAARLDRIVGLETSVSTRGNGEGLR